MYKELENHAQFWEDLPWMPNGQRLWAALAPHNPNILTTPMGYGSEIGKQAWIDKNLNPPPKKVFMSREKYRWANKNSILIDDFTKNTISNGIEALRGELQDVKNQLTELKAKEDRVQDLKEWKEKVDEVASPSQLKNALQEIEDLKVFKTKAVTIFAVIQFVMAGVIAISHLF
jgi:hypothetical protein